MAPGGFSTAVLDRNTDPSHEVSIHGVTLPASMGGYDVRIPNWRSDSRVADIQFLDVTMLASEMGIPPEEIPASHPDKGSFITTPLFPDQETKFDLIFCGGTVVRNHSQSFQSYRKKGGSEATRLLASQLVIAMNRIRNGGTMVVVLHRADTWANLELFHRFSKFSDADKMKLFKPARAHARKGSFYLVVRAVDPESMDAVEAVAGWRRAWRAASMLLSADVGQEAGGEKDGDGDEEFGMVNPPSPSMGDDEAGACGVFNKTESGDLDTSSEVVEAVLAEFGKQLVRLTRPVFKIQAKALRKAPWADKDKVG